MVRESGRMPAAGPYLLPVARGEMQAGVTLFITLSGGLVTEMITDCIEGMITQVFYLIIITTLLFMFDWGQITETLSGNPSGQSKLNPFDSAANEDFNIYHILMGILLGIYGTMAW